jgi:glycosyltransferase involved in cell wall biosynthesis
MKILQVNYFDNIGGAARIAWLLHQGFLAQGHQAWMAVGEKYSNDDFVKKIPIYPPRSLMGKPFFFLAKQADKVGWSLKNRNLSGLFHRLAEPGRYWKRYTGIEDFDFPGSRTILSLPSQAPEIVHFHNLHLNYFDLSYFQNISQRIPTIITLHDMWLLTGHCAYALDCERWKTGCGACPYLGTYPAMHQDQTAHNWLRKQHIFSHSRLHIVAPSNWLIRKAEQSMLAPALIQTKVIPNGVDLTVFYPKSKRLARSHLGLPIEADILLFVSASGMDTNAYKDYLTVQSAIEIVARKFNKRKLLFIALGGKDAVRHIGNVEIRYIPYQTSLELVASYYQAADIYLHAARADNFPNVVLEAQACGTPVIATAIGGIPEQITDGETGYLTEPENPVNMAEKIIHLLKNKNLRQSMGTAAGNHAHEHFGLDRMIDSYLDFYQEVFDREKES